MAELPSDPIGADLEDWVSAHFASRGCYVETRIKDRNPDEILELDVVWTDYRKDPEERHPVEVKSGDWGMSEVFRFYGWTRYLGLEAGQFIHKQSCGRVDPSTLANVQKKTGITFLHVLRPEGAEEHFKEFGFADPGWAGLPPVWRFSFWARRRLVKALSVAIGLAVCPETARAAKEYLRLVNDAVFFMPDVRDRIERLLTTHFRHQLLGRSAAYEKETGKVEFDNPPDTRSFGRALFGGEHFPIQACLYVEHRARVYIMKALVDYWLARERGGIEERTKRSIRLGNKLIVPPSPGITRAMETGLRKLSTAKGFRLFPVFWQVFLWGWGGFLLKGSLENEYAQLEKETGIASQEIPLALTAFDEIFPIPGGWFREPNGEDRRLLILMPAAMRGIGAHRRRLSNQADHFSDMKIDEITKSRLIQDNNSLARLLDCNEVELVK